MRTIILTIALITIQTFSQSYAQQIMVASSREAALASCEEKAAASPKDLREKMRSSCQCIVGKTDFKHANELNKAGDEKALKKLYENAAKACQ